MLIAFSVAPTKSARLGCSGSALPNSMKKVPTSGPEAPPTFMTRVIPIAFSISGSDLSARPGNAATTASKPRFMFSP